ncbi:MAG: alpha/beta hydrolase [Chitinophagaceae bacterium]|nr:MAG: alpha/beta hydrolase [Chitinophagaceae bacterium]
MQENNIPFLEGNLQYFKIGTGAPIVLVHGFGEDASLWNQHAALLSDQYQLIIPNLPGTGESSTFSDLSIYTLAESIKTIIDVEQIDQVTVIGHSMGGYTTLHFAERYPQNLNGMGLYHSSAFADTTEKIEIRKKGIEFIKKNGAKKFLDSIAENLFSNYTKENNRPIINNYIAQTPYFTDDAVINYYHAMINRTEKTAVLNNSSIPTLFIVGKEDKAVPVSDTMQQIHLPNTSFITILNHVGHLGMYESFERCHQSLVQFLNYCNP